MNFVNEAQATPFSGVDMDLKKDMGLELALLWSQYLLASWLAP